MLLRPPTLHLFAANVVIGRILFLLQQCRRGANFVCVTIKIILILLCLEVLIIAYRTELKPYNTGLCEHWTLHNSSNWKNYCIRKHDYHCNYLWFVDSPGLSYHYVVISNLQNKRPFVTWPCLIIWNEVFLFNHYP